MTYAPAPSRRRAGYLSAPRTRGALSGVLLIALGVWGGLVPFIGPYFSYAYTPDATWTWTAGRFWLEVLPAVATVIGGAILVSTANRAVGVFGGYLACAAGAWFVIGPLVGTLWNGSAGAAGAPVGGDLAQVVEQIGFFYGLGAMILFIAAQAVGRFSVRDGRVVAVDEAAQRTEPVERTEAVERSEPVERTEPLHRVDPVPVDREPAATVERGEPVVVQRDPLVGDREPVAQDGPDEPGPNRARRRLRRHHAADERPETALDRDQSEPRRGEDLLG